MTPRLMEATTNRETWQATHRYEVVCLFDWFWRVERDGRLVATVVEMHGQWRGWIGAICLNLTSPPKDMEAARKSLVAQVIGSIETAYE